MGGSKICFKCGKTQPRVEFYKHPEMGDGHLGKCKTCTKQDVHNHRLNNLEQVREYDRKRAKNPDSAKSAAEISKKWRQDDSRRTKCHNAVTRAVRKGDLVRQPCEICGRADSYAHHESYDNPLDVKWLCQPHHKERHKQMVILGIEI